MKLERLQPVGKRQQSKGATYRIGEIFTNSSIEQLIFRIFEETRNTPQTTEVNFEFASHTVETTGVKSSG